MNRSSDSRPSWVIVLDEVDEGVTERHFPVKSGDIDFKDGFLRFEEPFVVDVKIGRTLQTFSVKGTISGVASGDCSRCLVATKTEIETDFRLYIQRREAEADELEAVADEDEILVIDPGVREVDLTEALNNAVALEIPQRIHCRQDCRGLCGTCGADLNKGECGCSQGQTDPRWDALSKLK
ncbi:MAG: DUF177 domain-containing protein [Gemmatimonadetes bacterium]|nr:DUF177 domain-containing protein [Gemmatimonadota bacterium]MBT7859953.1 DUF177 domain-containing protein [Gemmatimonadota bacterium]